MRVRAARGGDFDRVAALLELYGRPALDNTTRDDAKAIYERQVFDPDTHHLVAEDDQGRVVAFCAVHFRDRLNHPKQEAWVPELFVLDAARDSGVGRSMLEEAERRARERGCHAIAIDSHYREAEAHLLLRKLRFRDEGKAFRKNLEKKARF